eukprot:1932076-Prymnesium_polylepis.1
MLPITSSSGIAPLLSKRSASHWCCPSESLRSCAPGSASGCPPSKMAEGELLSELPRMKCCVRLCPGWPEFKTSSALPPCRITRKTSSPTRAHRLAG